MKGWHSTTLRTADDHCIQAAAWLDSGEVPYDREVFSVGAAAHAVLEAVGHKTQEKGRELSLRELDVLSRAVATKLATEGRSFEGTPEPPMSSELAFAGRDLALEHLVKFPIEPRDGAFFERGFAIDSNGKPVAHSKRAFYRGIVDSGALTNRDEDELGRAFLIVRDYKSAWGMREGVLKSTQVRGYAVMAAEAHRDENGEYLFDILRLEVANLRTGGLYVEELYLPDELETLQSWKEDLLELVRARRKQEVKAHPGGGCPGCPFVGRCKTAHAYFLDTLRQAMSDDEVSLERLATSYATAKGIVGDWSKALQRATKGGTPIATDDGRLVGYLTREQRAMKDDGPGVWWDEWELLGGDGRGFALAAGLGVSAADKLAKFLVAQGATEGQLDQVREDSITTAKKEFFEIFGGSDETD